MFKPVQPKGHIKTISVEDVDRRQTLLIFPVEFIRRSQAKPTVATFQELSRDTLAVKLAGAGERLFNRGYKLVVCKQATWTSIPPPWLRNIGARAGDVLDLWETEDPSILLLQYRRQHLL